MTKHIYSIPVNQAYSLLDIGATCVVSARYQNDFNAMPANWFAPVNYDPFYATIVMEMSHYTRQLIEKTGYYMIQIPKKKIADQVLALGSTSRHDVNEKMKNVDLSYITIEGSPVPALRDCVAWVLFRKLPEENEFLNRHEILMGECIAAWARPEAFRDNAWHLHELPERDRPIHFVKGACYIVGCTEDTKMITPVACKPDENALKAKIHPYEVRLFEPGETNA